MQGETELKRSGTLYLQALNPEGVMQPRPIDSEYLIGNLPAREIAPDQELKPGIQFVVPHVDRVSKSEVVVKDQISFSTYGKEYKYHPAGFQGYLDVPESGMTELRLFTGQRTDADLYIDGVKVLRALDTGGISCHYARAPLAKGKHEISLQVSSVREVRLYWKLPGSKEMVLIPGSAFYHDARVRSTDTD